MPEHLRNNVDRDTCSNREGSSGVPQIMEAYPGEAGSFQVSKEIAVNARLTVDTPIAVWEDERVILPLHSCYVPEGSRNPGRKTERRESSMQVIRRSEREIIRHRLGLPEHGRFVS